MRTTLHTAVVLCCLSPLGAAAQPNRALPQTEGVGVEEHLGAELPLDAKFTDDEGRPVTLGSYFGGDKPVVLVFAYHSCEVLCSLVLNAAVQVLKGQAWRPGQNYEFVSVSIDPKDTAASARERKAQVLEKFGASSGDGWHFLTGGEREIERAAKAAGFSYKYDERTGQYAHAAVMMLATPEGKVARYLYGIEFNPNDVRLGLIEASEGRSVSTAEQLLLYCYRFDATGKTYVVFAKRLMQAGGALTAIVLFAFLFVFWRRDLRRGGMSARHDGAAGHAGTKQSVVTP